MDGMRVTVREILEASKGRLLAGDPDRVVEHIALDSRRMEGADLFVPIIGEKTDGHRYIAGAFANGAEAAFTCEHDQIPPELEPWCGSGSPMTARVLIRVEDTVKALQGLGLYLRSRLSMPVVGITGSVGKTTTRELVSCALSGGLKVTATEGNSNGQLGVPVTLGRMDPAAQIAVMEMGMSEPGEMARIAAIAKPDVALITNIGVSHIENLGSRENIFKEKLHITDGFTDKNTLIVNGDDDWLSTLRGKTACRLITYGMKPGNDLTAKDIISDGQNTRFTLVLALDGVPVEKEVRLNVPGDHNVMNAMAAAAAAIAVGVDLDAAIAALLNFHGFKRRLQWVEAKDLLILDDSYNASPESSMAAARVLAETEGPGRRIMIFADMLELGAVAEGYHRDVCSYAEALGLDMLITIGQLAAKGAALSGIAEKKRMQVRSFSNNAEAIEALPSLLQKGDRVLVKGSNGMHLEEIVTFLRETAL